MSENELLLDLLDKFVKLCVQNQTTLNLITEDIKEVHTAIGKSDHTLFQLVHRLFAESKETAKVHDKICNYIDLYTKREYTDSEIEQMGGPIKQIHELAQNLKKLEKVDYTTKIVETHNFVKGIKKRWKLIVGSATGLVLIITFAEKIIKLILFLHKLIGG